MVRLGINNKIVTHEVISYHFTGRNIEEQTKTSKDSKGNLRPAVTYTENHSKPSEDSTKSFPKISEDDLKISEDHPRLNTTTAKNLKFSYNYLYTIATSQ